MPIVEAVWAASAVGGIGKSELSKKIDDAKVAAIKACLAEGITDPDVIRERTLMAREAARQGQ